MQDSSTSNLIASVSIVASRELHFSIVLLRLGEQIYGKDAVSQALSLLSLIPLASSCSPAGIDRLLLLCVV